MQHWNIKEKFTQEKDHTIINTGFLNIPNSCLLHNVPDKEPLDCLILSTPVRNHIIRYSTYKNSSKSHRYCKYETKSTQNTKNTTGKVKPRMWITLILIPWLLYIEKQIDGTSKEGGKKPRYLRAAFAAVGTADEFHVAASMLVASTIPALESLNQKRNC